MAIFGLIMNPEGSMTALAINEAKGRVFRGTLIPATRHVDDFCGIPQLAVENWFDG
jgi:hypothetical protein